MALSSAEKDLLSRAIRRDREAFGELYLLYQKPIFRFVRYLVNDPHEADDLTSETFLRAWNAIDRFEDRDVSIDAWLLKIARNVAMRHLNVRNKRQHVDVEDVVIEANPRYSPERLAEGSMEKDAVRRAILMLPNMQRHVIVLRFLEHRDYTEVEAILGKSAGAIRVLQHRALKALKSLMGDTVHAERAHAGMAHA
jgi:RNA polymerase sigma-70 factor (ECF subfamily)